MLKRINVKEFGPRKRVNDNNFQKQTMNKGLGTGTTQCGIILLHILAGVKPSF